MSTEKVKYIPRVRRVYWVDRPEDQKDLLIFDGGYVGGDVHVYEYKETYPSKDIEEEMKEYYKTNDIPDTLMPEIVRDWVERKFGHSVAYDINP